MPYTDIIICAVFIIYIVIRDIMHTKERERLILLIRAEKPDIDKLITPPKKQKAVIKKSQRRVFGEVKNGGDNN